MNSEKSTKNTKKAFRFNSVLQSSYHEIAYKPCVQRKQPNVKSCKKIKPFFRVFVILSDFRKEGL